MIQRWALLAFQYCVSFTKLTLFVTTDLPNRLVLSFTQESHYYTKNWPPRRGRPHEARWIGLPMEFLNIYQEQVGPTLTHTFYLEDWDRRFPLIFWIRSPTDAPMTVSSYGPFTIPPPADYYFRPMFLELWTS